MVETPTDGADPERRRPRFHGLVVPHSYGELRDASHEEPGGKGARIDPNRLSWTGHLLDELVRRANDTGCKIAMTTEVFGGAVKDDIDAHCGRIGSSACNRYCRWCLDARRSPRGYALDVLKSKNDAARGSR